MAAAASSTPSVAVAMHRLRVWWTDNPRRMDWLAAGCLLAVSGVTTTSPGVGLTRAGQAAAVAGSILQSAALLRRRRAPVAVLAAAVGVLVVTVALTGDPVATEVGVAFAVYAVAVNRGPAVTWPALGVALVVAWVTYLVGLQAPPSPSVLTPGQALLTAMLGLLLMSLVALALGLTVRGRRVQVSALEERAQQLALERDQREELAAAGERARMAREMHDVVAHSVAVMVTLAHGAAASLDKRPDRSRQALAELSSTGRAALADMRRVVGLLREDPRSVGESAQDPAALSEEGGIASLVATFQDAGLSVRLVERGQGLPDDPRLRHAVYRVVQECLTNVLRHAPSAPDVAVTLDRSEHHVTITVVNRCGSARPPSSGGGHGLAGMRERVAAHRGTLEAGPTPTGWQVRATMYYDEETP